MRARLTMEMIQGAILPMRGIIVDCAGELSVFIIASNALLRSSSRDSKASNLYPKPRMRRYRVRAPIQRANNDRGVAPLTCKSDDVQCYAIHGGQNVHFHAVRRAVMNLSLPKIAHLSTAQNASGTRTQAEQEWDI